MKRPRGPIRSYTLALYPNAGKAEAARYAIWWATRWCFDYTQSLFAAGGEFKKASTAGLGQLRHDSQERARNVLRAGIAAAKANGRPYACPTGVPVLSDARICPSRRADSSFAYWVKVPVGPWLPARGHRGLTRALRAGAAMRTICEIRPGRRGGLVCRVFVEYPRRPAPELGEVIGADVGVNVGVATSDGRCSRSLRPLLEQHRKRNAERRRQGHRTASARTPLKQTLDREARRLVASASRGGKRIAIERLKTLGNLKPSGSIGGWARRHFGQRVLQIGEEVGVAVIQVHPAYTSQTCPRCNHVDPKNRRGIAFRCTACGYVAHADVVGACNIARKATGAFPAGTREGRSINQEFTLRDARLTNFGDRLCPSEEGAR